MAETLAPGGKRALWVGTDGGGLLRWQDDLWRVFDTKAGMANNSIWSLMPVGGRAGTTTLWVGTDGGAARMELGRFLEREGTTARAAIHRALEGFDVGRYLGDHGLTSAQALALTERFLSPAETP